MRTGDDAPMVETYCSIVGQMQMPFTTADSREDPLLLAHPARQSVLSYCGVLLRDAARDPFGALCHFDLMPCAVPCTSCLCYRPSPHGRRAGTDALT